MVRSGTNEILDDGQLVTIHAPHGHCMAFLTKVRASLPWRWYLDNNPDGTFEQFTILRGSENMHTLLQQ